MSTYTVVALYVFAEIADPATARDTLLACAAAEQICGTLLVAPEGFNGTLAATERASLERFSDLVADFAGVDRAARQAVAAPTTSAPGDHNRPPASADRRLELKWSSALEKPFQRLKVKLKPEIVTLRQPHVNPRDHVGTYVAPQDWNALISDPNVVVVDTRNRYEVEIGTFPGALNPDTLEFREFPAWVDANRARLEGKTIATFCTGGIRCEKATAYLQSAGFEDVRHLQGGILRYLEDVPARETLWDGACFVFDERVALGVGLTETGHKMCRHCQHAYLGPSCSRCDDGGRRS